MGRKLGGLCPLFGELGPHLTQCRLGRGLPPCQVSSWSVQPFGHNTPTSQTDKQTGQRSDSILANRFTNGRSISKWRTKAGVQFVTALMCTINRCGPLRSHNTYHWVTATVTCRLAVWTTLHNTHTLIVTATVTSRLAVWTTLHNTHTLIVTATVIRRWAVRFTVHNIYILMVYGNNRWELKKRQRPHALNIVTNAKMCNDYLICSNKYLKCIQVICAIQVPVHSGSHAYLCNTCILPIFLYGSECRAVTEVDACRIDALDQCPQWCLRTLHGIKWHQFVCNEQVRRITKQPDLTAIIQSFHIWAHCTYGRWWRCQDDLNSSPSRKLKETMRASPYHMAEHHPARSESLQPHTERSSRSGSEPSSVEADVYVWHYAFLVVHARKEEDSKNCYCHY